MTRPSSRPEATPSTDSRLVCGYQPVREAIRAHTQKIRKLFVEHKHMLSPKLKELVSLAVSHGIPIEQIPRSRMDQMGKGIQTQGVIAYAPPFSFLSLEAIDSLLTTPLVILDELEDPQNFGAAIRSAVALGSPTVIWPEHYSAPLSPTTFRASAGAIEHARLCRVPNLPHALTQLQAQGITVIGLDTHGELPLERALPTSRNPIAVVAGAEGKGLRKSVKRACSKTAYLTMQGPLASLNVSVALAIALYEIARARSPSPLPVPFESLH
ncbi:TrmH family RNA methyltransferase [Pajaroellobacter abortibovis]|uniref:RNA 2-O ribose methyltransferase substrate binding domain-containing protein n=1 Tax=Pajaroellobacter abortibovis TaxID=1882918 RepID=A0A1L6MWI0_9BACT|nr:RNA methyltransferase [Pajaroellobacter abortibovis]APR99777.1 hypothetical protein BCY86_03120 [Pajaroellobacter abortibovis]